MDLSEVINSVNQEAKSPDYINTLLRVCGKIKNDNWSVIDKGFLGQYLEIKSYDKTTKLTSYIDDFVSLDFKPINEEIIRKHPLYSLKFKDYNCQAYIFENEQCKVLFVYGSVNQLTIPETKTLNDIRREMLSIMSQLQQIMSGQKPNEIAILKIQEKDLSAI